MNCEQNIICPTSLHKNLERPSRSALIIVLEEALPSSRFQQKVQAIMNASNALCAEQQDKQKKVE